MPEVELDMAHQFVRRLLHAAGSSDESAAIVAGQLVDADACGYPSHGISLVSAYLDDMSAGRIDGQAVVTVENERRGSLIVDGGGGFGQVAATTAVERLIEETGANGIAIAALRRAGHVGRLGPYVEALADRGRIGVMIAGFALDPREAIVSPVPGVPRLFGTNPIAFGFPGGPTIDFATAAITAFRALLARERGEPLPDRVAVDRSGNVTRDAREVFDGGALLPFGSHKAAALSLAACLLGALSGEAAEGIGGTIIIAIDVASLVEPESFRSSLRLLETELASAPYGNGAFRLPGARARAARTQAAKTGFAVPLEILNRLNARACALNVAPLAARGFQ